MGGDESDESRQGFNVCRRTNADERTFSKKNPVRGSMFVEGRTRKKTVIGTEPRRGVLCWLYRDMPAAHVSTINIEPLTGFDHDNVRLPRSSFYKHKIPDAQ